MASKAQAQQAAARLQKPPLARYLYGLYRFMRRKPLGAAGLLIIVATVVIALAAPVLAPYNPVKTNADTVLLPPNGTYWFGTDIMGRDILTRVMYGARVSLFIGLVCMVIAISIGTMIGVTSAYFGGWYDLVVQRVVDAKSAFPSLLLALAFMAAFGSSLSSIIWAITIIFSSRAVRVVRSVTLSLKEIPYVDAARASGASNRRIVMLHILPNTFAPVVIMGSSMLGGVILIESSLSFLGVGTPAHIVSWGTMLSGDVQQYFASAPWIGLFPGAALSLVVFGINVFGDALRDVLDPKLRGR